MSSSLTQSPRTPEDAALRRRSSHEGSQKRSVNQSRKMLGRHTWAPRHCSSPCERTWRSRGRSTTVASDFARAGPTMSRIALVSRTVVWQVFWRFSTSDLHARYALRVMSRTEPCISVGSSGELVSKNSFSLVTFTISLSKLTVKLSATTPL